MKMKLLIGLLALISIIGACSAAENTTSDNIIDNITIADIIDNSLPVDNITNDNITDNNITPAELPDYYASDINEEDNASKVNLDEIESSANLTENIQEIINHTKKLDELDNNYTVEKDKEKRKDILYEMEYELNTLCDLFHKERSILENKRTCLENNLSKIVDDTEDSWTQQKIIEDKLTELDTGIKMAEKIIHEIIWKLMEIEGMRG